MSSYQFELPDNTELACHCATTETWKTKFNVDVPTKNGRPLPFDELETWINEHRHYSSSNANARGIEVACFGLALMQVHAYLEGNLASWLNNNRVQ